MKYGQVEEFNSLENWPKDVIFFVRIISLINGICKKLNENIPLLKILSKRAQEFLYNESINSELNKQIRIVFKNKYERRLSDYIERIMNEKNILGLQISVIKNGNNLVNISKGYKGELDGNKIDENTLFNGFFINIGILVISILICVERSLISLDDPICHYWDGFIRYGKRNITLRHVLNHRSGVISFFPEDLNLDELMDYERMIQIIEDSAPQIPINHITRYNPYFIGWVLSELISILTNQPTIKFIEENIINPFGLSDGIKINIPENEINKEEILKSKLEENEDEKINIKNKGKLNFFFFFKILILKLISKESSLGIMGLSNLKNKFENSNGVQLMNDLKEIIIQKLTPERMKKKEKEVIEIQEDFKINNFDIEIINRYAMTSRKINFSSITFKELIRKYQSESSLKLEKNQRNSNYNYIGNNNKGLRINSKLSTLECLYLKPQILDPLIYNSKNLINKWVPSTNGRYTSSSLAKLYFHLSRGEIISKKLLKEIITNQSVTNDNSIQGLILTYGGGPRKWSLGFQILDCIKFNHSKFKGIGHSDIGGNLSFCFPDIDLSIAILTNDYLKGSNISQLILNYILKNFGLYLDNYVPLFF